MGFLFGKGKGEGPYSTVVQLPEGETRMLSEKAQIGKRVRIRADHRSRTLRGMVGTIEERCGNPDYIALDVLLDDGRSELFWHHELEEITQSI
jgi:hypothetical protein